LEAIRRGIEQSDQTPGAIAKGAGVARSQLSRFLRGQRGLTVDAAEQVAEYLGLEIVVRPKHRKKGQ
jgi:plasmid maintenance system antidote protein VapI